jgi:hypothetical protein
VIVDKINTYLTESGKTIQEHYAQELGKLAEWSFKRQFCIDDEPAVKGKLRLSAAGKCPRQLAYAFHGFERKGKEKDSRSCVVFFQGDMVEAMVVQLAKLSGCTLLGTGLNQVNVSLGINGTSIPGHPDGFIIHEQEILLFECKSMSSFSYSRLEQGELDSGYIAQMESYMETVSKSVTRAVIVAVNKDSGVMNERIIDRVDGLISEIKVNLRTVLRSTPELLPDAPRTHDCDSKGYFPWQCLYCSFWGHCRPNAQKVLVGKSYKLKEIKGKEKKNEENMDGISRDDVDNI